MSGPLDWARVRDLFDQLCDLDEAARTEVLQRIDLDAASRALLASMLLEDGADRVATQAGALAPQLLRAASADERIGARVGAWRIDALIGAGGMGRVYRAHREDGRYQGLAAIKFVGEHAATPQFEQERQALARLQHPGIARLLDAGEDEGGRAYLVMELIDGVSITQYCREHEADARRRVELVRAAAEAAAHAHACFVLHRDLKPANVLVDRNGQVKLLDFGVAKLLDVAERAPDRTTARFFTLRYAAPEQIGGEAAGVAADVYALGVMLYELLSDQHPFENADGSQSALAERVLVGGARPLRRVPGLRRWPRFRAFGQHRLRDIEAVLDRALQRDPAARYRSIQAFADELQRVLEDRPVQALAPSARVQVLRLMRRHPVTTAITLVASLGLLALSLVALDRARAAQHERDLAQHEAARAERVAGFLSDLFAAVQPVRNQGQEPKARDLLDAGRDRLADQLNDDPALRARLLVTMADSYRALGHYDEAERLLRDALSAEGSSQARAQAHWGLGRVHNFQARFADAIEQLEAAHDLLDGEPASVMAAAIQRDLAVAHLNLRQFDSADVAVRASLRLLAAAEAAEEQFIYSETLAATVAYSRGDIAAAADAYQRIAELQRAQGDSAEPALVTTLNNLAASYLRIARIDEAIDRYRESVELAERRFGTNNREVALPKLGLGMALRAAGRAEAALTELRAAVGLYGAWAGKEHTDTAYAALLLIETRWLFDREVEPDIDLEVVSASLQRAFGTDSPKACRARWWQAMLAQRIEDEYKAAHCLESDQMPGNLRVLATYTKWRHGDSSPTELSTAASGLESPDALLQAFVVKEVGAAP